MFCLQKTTVVFRRKLKASVLLTAAADAGDRAAWLGYGRRRGCPKDGAHLLILSRVALAAFREHAAKEMAPRPCAVDALLFVAAGLGVCARCFLGSADEARGGRSPLERIHYASLRTVQGLRWRRELRCMFGILREVATCFCGFVIMRRP